MQQTWPQYEPVARIYGFRRWMRLFNLVYLYFVILVLLQNTWSHDRFGLGLWSVLLCCWVYNLCRTTAMSILIAPDGITYRALSYTIFARWEDVAVFGRTPSGFLKTEYGLILRNYRWWPNGIRERWPRQVHGFIPLKNSGSQYWEDGVADELRYHAPWLFPDAYTPAILYADAPVSKSAD